MIEAWAKEWDVTALAGTTPLKTAVIFTNDCDIELEII